MNRLSTVILALILLTNGLIVHSTTTAFAAPQKTCSGGWRITGYFVPVEADYSGPMTKVSVNGLGNVSFPKSFVNATATEGWGLTKAGWYLGKPGPDWLKSSIAENAHGGRLKVGSLAVGQYIELGSTISIPSAPSPWNTEIFIADDHGSAIQANHLDVFTGQGKAAERESFRVTSNGHTAEVCVTPPQT